MIVNRILDRRSLFTLDSSWRPRPATITSLLVGLAGGLAGRLVARGRGPWSEGAVGERNMESDELLSEIVSCFFQSIDRLVILRLRHC